MPNIGPLTISGVIVPVVSPGTALNYSQTVANLLTTYTGETLNISSGGNLNISCPGGAYLLKISGLPSTQPSTPTTTTVYNNGGVLCVF